MFIDSIHDVPHVEDKIFDAIKLSTAPVVLFGAGELSWYILQYLRCHGVEPVGVCDNNSAKQGKLHLGLPVYRYDDLKEKLGVEYNIVLSVGPQYKTAICSQLADAKENNPIWYLRGYEVCGEKINYQYIREHEAEFENAYLSFVDDHSKRVFINVLNAKISGDFILYEEIMSQLEYFDESVVKLTDTEVLLDVGAYKGDDIVEFTKQTNGKYCFIIAFEPDKKTMSILQNTIAQNSIQKVEVHNIGAWNKQTALRFNDGREGSSRVSESVDEVFPTTTIEVDTIDNILYGRRVTYISMDIEGAEHNALLGAEQTIKKWKPKMAVCVYHKREDLFDILLLLKSFVPEYKFYLRHYSDNQTETVLYAV